MIERVSNLAEKVATNISRRSFLDSAGRGAVVLAGVLGGFLFFPRDANAGQPICCLYKCSLGDSIQCFDSGTCPRKLWVCGTAEPGYLVKHARCASCGQCSACLGM